MSAYNEKLAVEKNAQKGAVGDPKFFYLCPVCNHKGYAKYTRNLIGHLRGDAPLRRGKRAAPEPDLRVANTHKSFWNTIPALKRKYWEDILTPKERTGEAHAGRVQFVHGVACFP
jgi:hypothetical protein